MNSTDTVYVIAMLLIAIVFLCVGYKIGYKEGFNNALIGSKKLERTDRQTHKLASTQQNIAGQIKNAIKSAISSNYQWGHRLLVTECTDENSNFLINLIDREEIQTNRIILEITVTMEDERLVATNVIKGPLALQSVKTNTPEDALLNFLKGRILSFVQNWSPNTDCT